MKVRKIISGLLSCVLFFSMLTACGSGEKQNEQGVESSQVQSFKEEPGKHILYIYDAGKSPEMTATFYNSMTGKSEDVAMQKVSEDDDHITYACNGNHSAYNMVHLTYGSESTMNWCRISRQSTTCMPTVITGESAAAPTAVWKHFTSVLNVLSALER